VKLVAHIWLSLKASGEKGSIRAKIQKKKRGKLLSKSQKIKRQAFKQKPKEKESQAYKQKREFMKRNTCAKDTWKGKPTLACI